MVDQEIAPALSRPPRWRTARYLFLAVIALLATASFIIGTPFALLAISQILPHDWLQFSNEGQAYGGVAAVFGMLTLVGVVASLVLQSRESAANRESAQRSIHKDLLFRALDDPDLQACWGPLWDGDDIQGRQHIYTNLIVSFWRSMFEIGEITDDQLHALSATMFANTPGRIYWSIAGPHQKIHYLSSRDRRFIQILEQEYIEATAKKDSSSQSGKAKRDGAPPISPSVASTGVAVIAGLAGGAVIAGFVSIIKCCSSNLHAPDSRRRR